MRIVIRPATPRIGGLLVAASLVLSACAGAATPSPTASSAASVEPAPSGEPSPSASPQLESEVVIAASGGDFEKQLTKYFYGPFEKATGVKVVPVAGTITENNAKLKADTDAGGNQLDIVTQSPASAFQNSSYLADIDCSALANVAVSIAGTCEQKFVLRTFGGGILAYNTEKFPNGGPQTWADFFDTQKFPGPRGMNNAGSPEWVLAIALLADGVPPDQLFPIDYDRAFAKLDQLKPNIAVWWTSGDQSMQIFRDDQVVMSFMWSGRAVRLKGEGLPIEVGWNQAIKDFSVWSVAREAPHPNAARAFLDFYLGNPQSHLGFMLENKNSTSNAEAAALLPEAEKPNFGATYWDEMINVDGNQWVAEHRAEILEKFTAWLGQ